MDKAIIKKIGFGGGCHWCTEAVFNHLIGVKQVQQGWIASDKENDAYSEAVIVHYDPSIIPIDKLIEIHLHTHSSSSNHPMRKKYRSAVYYFDVSEIPIIRKIIDDCSATFAKAVISTVIPFVSFRENEEKYQNYYQKNSEGPFCQNYINPKIELLNSEYGEYVRV